MKKNLIALLTLSILLPACSSRSAEDETFARLVQESLDETKLCHAYEAATKEAWQKIDLEKRFSTREEALKALELFAARPTVFPKSEAAGAYFLAHYRALVSSRNPFSNLENRVKVGSLAYDCDFLRGRQVIPNLVVAANRFNFGKEERARVERLARSFLGESAEPKRADALPVIVALVTLDLYLDAARPSAEWDPLRHDVKRLLRESAAVRPPYFLRREGFWNGLREDYFGAGRIRETETRLRLGARYASFYRRAFPNPAPE